MEHSSRRGSPCRQSMVACIIHLFFFLAATGLVGAQSCVTQDPCLGGRPRTSTGCCPVAGGDSCGNEVGVQCDTDLGYLCLDARGDVTILRGICTGRFNVRVTDTAMDRVSLEWNDFKPEGYIFEYVLLFRQDSYIEDTESWTLWDIGTEPHYTVTKLSAGSLYFMRLAVWGDARATILANLTETVMVVTDAASNCKHMGDTFTVGQVVQNCEDRCTCMATGLMQCSPLCPEQQLSDLPEGCTLIYEEECSCNATVHCPAEQAPCNFEGEQFEPGSTVTVGCRTCHCNLGTMTCTYPENCEVVEASEGCPHPVATPDPAGGCCPTWTCNAGFITTVSPAENCLYNGIVYADTVSWVDTNACLNCTCVAGQARCLGMCEEPVVPDGCLNPVLRHTAGSGCCQIVVCESTAEGADRCNHNGTVYSVGDTFTSDCSLCMCTHGNTVNCSFNTCPPLEIPVPSILCPFPNVRQDGCCDTVFCFEDNDDAQDFMSRMMAMSFGPYSLTISFEVDHLSSASTVTQDRYEVMTSDSESDANSWSSRTYTARRVDTDDNVSSPSDLLHADAAIRVDDRMYITLDGLNPNTTYYVRVQPVVKRDMGVTDSSTDNATLTGFIVARTIENEFTCLVGDMSFRNGEKVSEKCGEICKCVDGYVKCQSTCLEEELVVASSSVCPRPLLVPSQHSCCKTWKCFPKEGGCLHNGLVLEHGEQVYDGSCERKCRCTAGTVICTPVCPPASPAPHAECFLKNVTNACCPVWMCPQETKAPVEISLTSQIGFHGTCPDENSTYKSSFRKAFESRLEGHLPCADRESPYFVMCWIKDVIIHCPHSEAYRKRRQTAMETDVITVVTANITESYAAEKIETSLNITAKALSDIFSSQKFLIMLQKGQNMTSSGKFVIFGVSPVCESGFIYRHNVCVPENLFTTSLQHHNVSMVLREISHHSATFTWSSLPQHSFNYVIGLMIEFRSVASITWNRTTTLHPFTTDYTLMYLSASHRYLARLVALTNLTSAPTIPLSAVKFTTKDHEVLAGPLTFNPLQVSLGLASVTISWTPQTKNVTSAIKDLQIVYSKSQDTSHIMSLDIDPNDPHVTLKNLVPGTVYVCKFQVVLVNGTHVITSPLHFVTRAEDDSSDVPIVPLLATCVVVVFIAVLIPIAFFVWRRMRRKSGQITFENKIYGINISSLCATRAKNDSAPHQDPENGGGVASNTVSNDCRPQA